MKVQHPEYFNAIQEEFYLNMNIIEVLKQGKQ